MSHIKLSMVCAVLLVACAGDGDSGEVDTSSRDPRCVSACTASEPPYQGIGEVCDSASRVQCLDECETRIASVTTVCQNCLVEDACFGPDGCFGDDGPGYSCTDSTCTLTSVFGTCSFPYGDEPARLKCLQQVDPRREVSCKTSFRATTECASVCN
ncbi:MAG TPA: hypothetical protein VIV40_25220 [Kofleriaceae bacterium]